MNDTSVTKPERDIIVRPERKIPVVMTLVFLPWFVVVFFSAGGWAALNFLAYAWVVSAAGYGVIRLALPASARTQTFVFAPAVGILVISALSAIWLRFGLPLIWVPALWLIPVVAGLPGIWADRVALAQRTVAYGVALAILSTLICAVYFLPSARNDAVLRRDGSFNWIYVDTQHFYAIAAGIKSGQSPPRVPGHGNRGTSLPFRALCPGRGYLST